MPDFEYRGASPGLYPMLRDSYGVLAGHVTPGDALEFPEAPDADWAWLDPAERERAEADRQEIAGAIAELTAPLPADSGGERGGIESAPDPADVPAGGEHDQDSGDAGHDSDDQAGEPGEED